MLQSTDTVTAHGLGLVRAIVDQAADFHVDTNGLRGSLKVQVDGQCEPRTAYQR